MSASATSVEYAYPQTASSRDGQDMVTPTVITPLLRYSLLHSSSFPHDGNKSAFSNIIYFHHHKSSSHTLRCHLCSSLHETEPQHTSYLQGMTLVFHQQCAEQCRLPLHSAGSIVACRMPAPERGHYCCTTTSTDLTGREKRGLNTIDRIIVSQAARHACAQGRDSHTAARSSLPQNLDKIPHLGQIDQKDHDLDNLVPHLPL